MKVNTKTKTFDIDASKAFASGGEGSIIKLNGSLVAKIYHDSKKAICDMKLLELSVLPSDMFVKPLEIIYQNGSPIGYTMDYLEKSKYIPLDALVISGCNSVIMEKVCKGVELAHKHNIVIGDLNMLNVMVDQSNNDVKFIDVDSYQTPSFSHSGVVLQEISDKQRNSEISIPSDCFSLAVCLFTLMTKVHPFKGMHKVYKNGYVDRMLNKLPIITGNEPDIKVPKMFIKPSNELCAQFNDIFTQGKRYIINISGAAFAKRFSGVITVAKNIRQTCFGDVENIRSITFCDNSFILNYDDHCEIYKCGVKGHIFLSEKITFNDKRMFIPNRNSLFSFDGKELKNHLTQKVLLNITGNVINTCSDGDIFNIVTEDYLFKIDLSKEIIQTTSVYGLSFNNTGSLLQTITNSGKSFSILNGTTIIPKIESVRTKGSLSLGVQIENGITSIVKAQGNNLLKTEYDNIPKFNYNFGMFTLPEDGKIKILASNTSPLMEIEFSEVNENSFTLFTPSGIVVIENNKLYLLNMI